MKSRAKPQWRDGYQYIRGQKVIPPKERLLSSIKINEITQCWVWKGAKKGTANLKQYGNLMIGSRANNTRKSVAAHRYSYEVFVGPIPEGMWVLHKCDNPPCINPSHLFLGDRQANVDDREGKGRNKVPGLKHEKHPNCKLSWDEVNAIRSVFKVGRAQKLIAEDFGISRRAINDIINYKTWRPEPPKGEGA